MSMYQDIKIILGTKHKKEEAIKKPFENAFRATIIVPTDYDTDQFGTFTGEIERVGSPYETVIKKASEAALSYGIDYAIANEGSFGAHPTIFFSHADIELISFIDLKNNIIVVESEITTETNYAQKIISINDNYTDFLKKIKFGSHGLVIRGVDNGTIIAKGITDFNDLVSILKSSFQDFKQLRLETDMRAMMNPTRMNIINKLAVKLVKRLQNKCAQCASPGFGKTSVVGKLSCEACGTETELYEFKVLSCVKCDYQEYVPRSDQLKHANPRYCPCCNP